MGLFSKFFGAPSSQASMPRKPSTPPPAVFGTRPAPVPKPEPSAADLDTMARDVAGAFGDLMQSPDFPVFGASTADVNKLPYPKEVIKASLKYLLMATDDPYLREMIKGSYLTLALFQEGVGDKGSGPSRQYIEKLAADVGRQPDPRSIDWNAELKESTKITDNIEKWSEVVSREMHTLQADIDRIERNRADHALHSAAR